MEDRSHDLEEQARERVEKLPAETALGHRDPEGGGEGDPLEYEREHTGEFVSDDEEPRSGV